MSRSLPSSIAGVVAVLATVASTTFLMIFAITLTAGHLPTRVLAIAAAVTQLLLLAALAYVTFRQVYRGDSEGETIVMDKRLPSKYSHLTLLILASFVAALVAAATLGRIKVRLHTLPDLILGRSKNAILMTSFAVWSISLLAQTAFFFGVFWNKGRPRQEDLSGYVANGLDIEQPMEEPSRPNTAGTAHPQRSQEAPLLYPSSPTATEALNSLRSSLSVVVRPVTSRTRLITRQHSFPRDSKSSSLDISLRDRTSQDDGFDTWDTSGVGSHIRETVMQSSPPTTRGPCLETIPGSRSPSPAKALDGPYNLPSPPQSPTHFSRPSSSRRQRSASASNEDHIHPLFRTSSPTPPPTATPGTRITATPLAGQLMDAQALRRMRSGSLPASPSPLTYFDSINNDPVRRIPTPPSREMTPPIPDFILTAGARASLMGYGRRKLSLRPSEADVELEQPGSGG